MVNIAPPMQKEKIITIVIGLLIGVTAAGFFFFSNKYKFNFGKNNPKVNQSQNTNKESLEPTSVFVIEKPLDGLIATESAILVSGTGQSGSVIILVSNTSESKTIIPATGHFDISVKLESGENRIQAIYLQPGQDPQIVNRTVNLDI